MKEIIYITGHKNPDTDSICSALGYSELKNRLNFNALPVRLGKINKETEFVLNYFKVEPPKYISSIKTKVSDLNLDKIDIVKSDISIKEAWDIMQKNTIQFLPVVDDNDKFTGVVSISDIAKSYINVENNNSLGKSNTPVKNIANILMGKVIVGDTSLVIKSGKIVVCSMTAEKMEEYIKSDDIVITGNREDSQLNALDQNISLLIITGVSELIERVKKKAKIKGVTVIVTHLDTFTASRLIIQSIPIDSIMSKKDIVSFNGDDFIDEVREKMIQVRHKLYPVIDNDGNVLGALARYHLISRIKKKVILLDHNEKSQSVSGLDEAEIIEVIDHHKIGDIQTASPIYVRNEPVGCTATIVYHLFMQHGLRPTPTTAGLLCSAILSDTLKFKSPTCTRQDIDAANDLAQIASVDINKFAEEMFKAGSSLEGKSAEEIIFQDFKDFNIKDDSVGIGQIIVMNIENVSYVKEKILRYMKELVDNKSYDTVMLLVTEISKESSELLCEGKNKDKIFKRFKSSDNDIIYLDGVVSRKKQLVPEIVELF